MICMRMANASESLHLNDAISLWIKQLIIPVS